MFIWHDSRAMNLIANAIYSLVMCALLAAGVWWLSQRPMFTINAIVLEPVAGTVLENMTIQSVQKSDVMKLKGNFFTLNLDAMREQFENIPWVRRARVRREWPDRLTVAVEEYRAFALWGDAHLLNREGELFQANLGEAESDGPLPHLSGPQGTEKKVVKRFSELVKVLEPLGVRIDELTLTDRYAWQLTLDSGTEIFLGRDDDVKQFNDRIDRIVKIYPELVKRYGEIDYIDVRYLTGMAVRSKNIHVINPDDKQAMNAANKPKTPD